jgi:hypothetical protein
MGRVNILGYVNADWRLKYAAKKYNVESVGSTVK